MAKASWNKCILTQCRQTPYPPEIPLWCLPKLMAPLKAHDRTPCRNAEITTLCDIYAEGIHLPFPELQNNTGLEASAFLTYNALTLVIQEIWDAKQQEPLTHSGLQCTLTHGMSRHAITMLYSTLTP